MYIMFISYNMLIVSIFNLYIILVSNNIPIVSILNLSIMSWLVATF